MRGDQPRPTLLATPTPVGPEPAANYPMADFSGSRDDQPHLGLREILVDAIKNIYQEWDDARRPHLSESARCWDRYNNQWDFSDKEDWQAQKRMPVVTNVVERLTATMSRLMTLAKDKWFAVKTLNPKKEYAVNLAREWTLYQLKHPKVKFRKFFKRALKVAFLSHIMPALASWEVDGFANPEYTAPGAPAPSGADLTENLPDSPFIGGGAVEQQTVGIGHQDSFLRLELLHPRKVLLDPTGRNRGYIIERRYTKAEFQMEARARGWMNVDAVMESEYKGESPTNEEDASERLIPNTVIHDDVMIQECWFDHLWDEKGYLIPMPFRNFSVILANEEHIVQEPLENPFWHKRPPLVAPALVDVPFGIYHMSPVGISLDALELWVTLLNMMIDYYQQAIIGIKEMDTSIIHSDEDQDDPKVWPGKVFKKTGPGQLFSQSQVADPPQTFPFFLQVIQNVIGESTAMKDATEGAPRTRSRMSAQEYVARIAESGTLLDSYFENVEDDFLVPLLEMAYLNSLQFTPHDVWADFIETRQERFKDIADRLEEIKGWSAEERFRELGSDIFFETKVFSAVFDRQQEIEKATFLLATAGRIPMGQVHIKWANFLGRLADNLGYDREEVISTEPLVPYSEVIGGKNAETGQEIGSDGGEATPTQPPSKGQLDGQASGVLGGSGQIDKTFKEMMPGTAKPGAPR